MEWEGYLFISILIACVITVIVLIVFLIVKPPLSVSSSFGVSAGSLTITASISPENSITDGANWKVRFPQRINFPDGTSLSNYKTHIIPQIIGGTPVSSINEMPWMCSLNLKSGNTYNHFCGATIIAPRYVMTAAHCADVYPASDVYVRSSVVDLNLDYGDVNTIEEIFIHPNFNPDNLLNGYDIAILKLTSDIKGTPINLTRNDSFLHSGLQLICSGWGLTDPDAPDTSPILLKVTLPFGTIFNGRILILGGSEQKNICFGDSGGPCIYEIDGKWYQVGITSFTTGDNACESNSGWTRVSSMMDFIEQHVSFNFYDSGWVSTGNMVDRLPEGEFQVISQTINNDEWTPPNDQTVDLPPDQIIDLTYTSV